MTCSGPGSAGAATSGDALGEGEVVADLAHDLGHRHVEGVTDRAEQLGRGFLLAALDLGEVAEGDPGSRGDLAQGAVLGAAAFAEDVTEQPAEQDHGLSLGSQVPGGLAARAGWIVLTVRPPYPSAPSTSGLTRRMDVLSM